MAEPLNILFTSVGRRVSLVRLFRKACDDLGVSARLMTADLTPTAPARFVGDVHVPLPRVTDPSYVDDLLTACFRHDIRLVVPLIDPELSVLAPHRERFLELGIVILLSSEETITIAQDKRDTTTFLLEHGIPGPVSIDPNEILRQGGPFPVLLKPARGSAGKGVHRIEDERSLRFYLDTVEAPIVQELIEGTEYTIDVLVDRNSRVRSVVPRQRLEVRSGEVSKGMTSRNDKIIDAARRLAESMPGAFGPITLQCFLTPETEIRFIEINPRFGGGFPLSAEAGADFPRWILEWLLGRDPEIGLTDWVDGLYMLRYDDAIFVSEV